jgi:hypothetical protein
MNTLKEVGNILLSVLLISCTSDHKTVPEHFKVVDQVIWVVKDVDKVIDHWTNLGFTQITDLDTLSVEVQSSGTTVQLRMAKANLGGAHITWIQPLEKNSLFAHFNKDYGDGAMSLVHRFQDKPALLKEIERLNELGVDQLEEITVTTPEGDLDYIFMDTRSQGKYVLGYTFGNVDARYFRYLKAENLHQMRINQYAFAIIDQEPVSAFWAKIGQPEFQINNPELGNMHYYGEPTDHELIQGWQRHGSVSYEWCIPVKPPIVYDDHIKDHGEGIHHLAFTIDEMDKVIEDYESKGYVNSMGGTWGEKDRPGSGRYEYINLEEAGGLTMELLWNFK